MNVVVGRLTRESEQVRPEPCLNGQPRAAGRLAEIHAVGDFHVKRPEDRKRGVRVAGDGPRRQDDLSRAVGSVMAIARLVDRGQSRGVSQPPVSDRSLRKNGVTILDAHLITFLKPVTGTIYEGGCQHHESWIGRQADNPKRVITI